MNRWKIFGPWTILLVFSLYLTIFTGCDNSTEDPIEVGDPALEQLQIICHDLCPSPGETAQLTVQVEGFSPSGEWPTYTWTVDGGSFPVTNTGISVEWLTPETPGQYNVSVIGTLGGLADTTNRVILVRNFEELDTGRMFNCAPKFVYNALYFFGDADGLPPRSLDFKGFHCYKYLPPGITSLVSVTGENVGGGYTLEMPDNGTIMTGSFIEQYFNGLSTQRLNVWIFPLTIGTPVNVTDDGSGNALRMNQHVYPVCNTTGSRVVWEARFPGDSRDGTEDLSNVGFWESLVGDTIYVTESHDSSEVQQGPDIVTLHRYYNNIKPTLTPSQDMLIYFVDTTGVFEPCIIDLTGDIRNDISSRRALMLDEYKGIFQQEGIRVSRSTEFQWNQTLDMLTFIDSGKNLCFFDPYSESVTIVEGPESVEEFVWSPDGTECAIIDANGIWLVSAGGVVSGTPVFTREKGTDDLIGLNWSANTTDPKLGFRMIRKGKTVEDSYSAIMISYLNDGVTAYASPSINWHTPYEPEISYKWKRVFFDQDENIYAPIPTPSWSGDPDRDVECAIFYSYN